MRKLSPLFTLLFMAILSLCTANAFASDADDIKISNPYVREVPPGAMATGSFLTLKNTSQHTIRLVKASSDAAKTVQLHTHIHDQGVMKMRQVKNITILANSTTELKPGGLHIMLIGIQKPIVQGQIINLTLYFEDKSHVEIHAPVQSVMSPMMHPNH